jgi:DNA-binding GntR family transcriptional regulator
MSAVPGDGAIKRTCMRDRIRDVLVARILDGHYPAGTQLKELTLAREFSVSQAPIREALRELEGSGLVTSERYRGTRVRGADPREMRDSYELRATIEARAVELAIPVAPDVIARFEAHLADMRRTIEAGDTEGYIDAALALHRALIEASGNAVFVTVWDSLHFEVRGRLVLRLMAAKAEGFQPLILMHATLIDQVRAGDAQAAVATLRALFRRVAETF